MPDQIHDQCSMNFTDAVQMILEESVTAHGVGVEVRRLLGIEDSDDEVALQSCSLLQERTGLQGNGNRRRIVIGTWMGNDAVIMSANKQRGESAVSTQNTADEIVEVPPAGSVGQFKGIADERLAADLFKSHGQVTAGVLVSLGTHHTPLRVADGFDIVLQKIGENGHALNKDDFVFADG